MHNHSAKKNTENVMWYINYQRFVSMVMQLSSADLGVLPSFDCTS